MSIRTLASLAVTLFIIVGYCQTGHTRGPITSADRKDNTLLKGTSVPAYGTVAHRIGKIVLSVSNWGILGSANTASYDLDFFTGEAIPACEYPKGADNRYLYLASFWIGAVVGRDTLVSCASTGWESYLSCEFSPDMIGFGEIKRRSTIANDPSLRKDAVSEEDYIMVYTDTLTEGLDPDYFGRPHVPLNIEVTQRSYAWSYSYAEDFILFDYTIRNIGYRRLENVYMGIYVDGDVHFGPDGFLFEGAYDDLCGFRQDIPREYGNCTFHDTLNIAWIADNDGDPNGSTYDIMSVPGVTATRIVRTPNDSLDISFNWWIANVDPILDFGPRERPNVGLLWEDFRDFRTGGLGTPSGDNNKYYMLRNREFDYDQAYTAIVPINDPLWLPPPAENAATYADGFDTRYLLSFGPFDIDPGERLPLSFAYIAGENLHTNPDDVQSLPFDPAAFYANLDFSDLALNAVWAGRIYDNPGVDTDGDGYQGKVRLCCDGGVAYSLDNIIDTSTIENIDPSTCEFIWYEGDGVPDFRGASPPPAPDFWLETSPGNIRVRINGQRSETGYDVFTGSADFEGYRVYIGRDDRESSYSLLASYDKEDYDKYVWTGTEYRLFDIPFTIDSLRCLYGTSCEDTLFDPLYYGQDNPFRHPLDPDSIFYFVPHDFNFAGNVPGELSLRKTYPEQPYPSSLNPDSADQDELTEDGYFKYFEYEMAIGNLLPTVPYWVNVTAFDFGSPEAEMLPLESSVTVGARCAFADTPADQVVARNMKVYVYPNPYRIDADYRDAGFEGRTNPDRPNDRVRTINFANLPPKCIIRIYSLDGDLIREIKHDFPASDPTASHDSWDLITRNTQMVTSGLYYWTVEAENGETQIGKFVIVM